MWTQIRKALSLSHTPIGRRRIARGALFRSWPILGPLASVYRRTLSRRVRIVAVVGSFGKTTATRAVRAAVGLDPDRHKGWNAAGFVAAALLRIPPWRMYGVLEAGISEPGWMQRYARWIRPTITVVTSIGSEHHTSLGPLESTRHEKAFMVRALPATGLAVLNGDDPHVIWMRDQTRARVVTYGWSEENDIRASDIVLDRDGGTRFLLHTPEGSRPVRARLTGWTMVYPLLAAAAVAWAEGRSLDTIVPRLETLGPSAERMEAIQAPGGVLLLLDTVKSFQETIEAGLDVLDALPADRRIAVLGDIEEPQGKQGPLYKALGARLALTVDRVVHLGGRKTFASMAAGACAAGLPRDCLTHIGRDVLDAAESLRGDLRPGDVVWIKGRSTQHLGRIGLALAGRDVQCRVLACPVTPGCASCVMLERHV